jgi:hypothetical protein
MVKLSIRMVSRHCIAQSSLRGRESERERERALVSATAREGEGDEGGERRGVAVASPSFASYDIYRKL